MTNYIYSWTNPTKKSFNRTIYSQFKKESIAACPAFNEISEDMFILREKTQYQIDLILKKYNEYFQMLNSSEEYIPQYSNKIKLKKDGVYMLVNDKHLKCCCFDHLYDDDHTNVIFWGMGFSTNAMDAINSASTICRNKHLVFCPTGFLVAIQHELQNWLDQFAYKINSEKRKREERIAQKRELEEAELRKERKLEKEREQKFQNDLNKFEENFIEFYSKHYNRRDE